jgi:segregation and condensation protein B
MELSEIKYFIESALLAAGRPLNIDQIKNLFDEGSEPEKSQLREALAHLSDEYAARGIEIAEVASGFRMQIKASMAERLHKLWEEKPPRYSRALFETLALIAYRQPMTRGEIEEVRGVSVSSNIVRSLLEREWIRVVGHRDVPGRPALFGTTRLFLDYFGLKKLEDLPPLADLSDWESLRVQLNLPQVEESEVAIEAADITELPVLHPAPDAESESIDDADENPDLPLLPTDEGFEELVASEWPDPAGPADSDDAQEEAGIPEDLDATISST